MPMAMRSGIAAPVLGIGGLAVASMFSASAAPAPGVGPDFERDVRPILQANCVRCHGEQSPAAGLDLRSVAAILRGGRGGPVVLAGAPGRSRMITAIGLGKMPPSGKPLSAADQQILKEWVRTGARAGASSRTGSHWAFQPPSTPTIPAARDTAWARNPIDRFVARDLSARGLKPSVPADRLTLLRRVTIDLTGLPPTPEAQREFLADSSADAYERRVDQLLASPAYAERWARKWLDVARYADTNGYERDGDKPNVWRYRDYVVDSFHADKPYDQFIREQLAGDELPNTNAETQIATTFLRLGTWDDEPAEPELDRYEQLDDIVGTTTTAFLGITLRCARCHDHKFEPFLQKEYYQVLSVFQPLKRPQEGRNDLDRHVGTPIELQRYQESVARADAAAAVANREMEPLERQVWERLVARGGSRLPAPAIEAFRAETARRTEAQKNLVRQHEAARRMEIDREAQPSEAGELARWRAAVKAADGMRLPEPPRAYIWFEASAEAPPTRLLTRGNPAQPADVVSPGIPGVLQPQPSSPPKPQASSTGRRLWFADWVASRANPLTARVMVNRVWQGHFGEGLVPTENDFGTVGGRPRHRELLDWLASRFASPITDPNGMGWSMKRLHRLIVTSATYRQGSGTPEQAKRDPDGSELSRWVVRRLDAEAARDSILSVSGRLNLKRGGPGVYPKLPQAVLAGQSRPGAGWGNSSPEEASRRSIYVFAKRSLGVPELELLDSPDTTSSCEQRAVSTTAPQALTFINGTWVQEQAAAFARRLKAEAGADSKSQVRLAFRLAVGREPRTPEMDRSLRFLSESVTAFGRELQPELAQQRALESLSLVMLNSNDFWYLR